MNKRIIFEGFSETIEYESTWHPELPSAIKTRHLGLLAIKAMTVFNLDGSNHLIAEPGYTSSEESDRIEEEGFAAFAVDNIAIFFNSMHAKLPPKRNCHSFGYEAQGWRQPAKSGDYIATRDLRYEHEALELVSFDKLVPGDLYSITSSDPNEKNYHSFIPLSQRPLALSVLGPDGPLAITDIHELFGYYGGDRIYKIKTPAGGTDDILEQHPRHLPTGTERDIQFSYRPEISTGGYREAYNQYMPEIAQLYGQALEKPPNEIPGYLGSGRYFHTFKLPSKPLLVAKIPLEENEQLVAGNALRKFSPPPYNRINETVSALARGAGIKGLERLIASSNFTFPAVITEWAGDRTIEKLLQKGEIDTVPYEAWRQLIETFEGMDQHQLSFDRVPSNIVFNDKLLTVLDYLNPYYAPRYMRPQTLYDRVVVTAGPRILLCTLREGDTIPPHALLYRQATTDTLGEDWGWEIDKLWRESGFTLP